VWWVIVVGLVAIGVGWAVIAQYNRERDDARRTDAGGDGYVPIYGDGSSDDNDASGSDGGDGGGGDSGGGGDGGGGGGGSD
jgi:uncharacterized membrane protein YgcG